VNLEIEVFAVSTNASISRLVVDGHQYRQIHAADTIQTRFIGQFRIR
jgi:hypothetical protein